MPKLSPYYIPKENAVKVEEVRYLDKNYQPQSYEDFMKDYEPNQQVEVITEAEYQDRVLYGPQYGPGWEDWIKFGAKTAIVVGGGFVLGPIPAMVVGGVTAGAAKVAKDNCNDEDAKEFFGFVGDCGGGIATGGVIGAAAQGAGAILGAGEVLGLGSNVANAAARRAAGEYFIVDGIKVFSGNVSQARAIAAAAHGAKVAGDIEKIISAFKDAGYTYYEAREHAEHVRDGYNYKS